MILGLCIIVGANVAVFGGMFAALTALTRRANR